ncbi:hypothetical protein HSBAA_04350 [Vreelandella sulfidaeris]|uniref:Uncharacterized protein n=1 Tax=Vreelandella sulfidaeris TaxID=115553 RepID=A0A455U314_9GAMM|nr:hypothetical protein HSBAA_04350 [Halomonas sulfidaeris]
MLWLLQAVPVGDDDLCARFFLAAAGFLVVGFTQSYAMAIVGAAISGFGLGLSCRIPPRG